MKHTATRELFAYWNRRRGTRPAPERGEIEPSAIRRILGDTFILALERPGEPSFRLAGTRVCALFGRELKGRAFVELWEPSLRGPVGDLVDVVAGETIGVVSGVAATNTEGQPLDLEMLLLPLAHRGQLHARLIGVLAPVKVPHWLGATPLAALTMGPLRHLGATIDVEPSPSLVGPEPTRMRKGFVVHDGGRV